MIIEFKDVSFGYGDSEPILKEICLSVTERERACLVGRNGSGKSTLLKLAAGILQPRHGTVLIDGVATTDKNEWFKAQSRIGFAFQNPEDQIVAPVVEDDLAFGLENLGTPLTEIRVRVESTAEKYALSRNLLSPTGSLSAGEKQRLALAGVLISSPDLLLLDEPASYLDQKGRILLRDTVRRLPDATILAATPFVEEINEYRRVLFLENGVLTFDGTPAEFADSPWGREMRQTSRSKLQLGTPNRSRAELPAANFEGRLEAADLSFGYRTNLRVIDHFSADFRAREITVIVGESGSGKTTLALLLARLLKPTSGDVTLHFSDRRTDPAGNVALALQFPETSFFSETVFDEVAFAARNQGITGDELTTRVRSCLTAVGLDFDTFSPRSPFELSAGEQRRVALAAVLVMESAVCIFDEPTIGLDWVGRRQFVDLLQFLRAQGRIVVVITHDDLIIDSVADKVVRLTCGE